MQSIVFAALLTVVPAFDQSHEHFNPLAARKHAIELAEQGETRQLTTEALDGLLDRAAELLTARGYGGLAGELAADWRDHYRLATMGVMGDMGDHEPLSAWLAETYGRLEAALGPDLCDLTHLSDLNVLNYTAPVVFSPHASEGWCQEHLKIFREPSCAAEYRRHFAGTKWQRGRDAGATARIHSGLAPVATYWVVLAACQAALWGTDGATACTQAAGVAEVAVARYVAPQASLRLWKRFNP